MERTRTVVAALALVAASALSGCSGPPAWDGGPDRATPSAASPVPTTPAAPTPRPTPSPTPSAADTPTPSTSPTPTSRPTPSSSPSPTREPAPAPNVIRPGDSGPKVRALQQRLAALGYWLGAVDGDFGPITQQAVFALQKSAGIARDGVVGPDTERALARGVRPTATLRGDGVEIDLGRQVLVVVRGGKVVTILNTSTGNGEWYTTTYGTRAIARTPTGTFTFLRRVDGMDESSLGKLWRPIYFTDTGYAVHGSSSVPPWPASHGCVRISNAAIDMVWGQGLMPVGSTIRIR